MEAAMERMSQAITTPQGQVTALQGQVAAHQEQFAENTRIRAQLLEQQARYERVQQEGQTQMQQLSVQLANMQQETVASLARIIEKGTATASNTSERSWYTGCRGGETEGRFAESTAGEGCDGRTNACSE